MQEGEGQSNKHNGGEFIRMVREHALKAAKAPAPSAAVQVDSNGVRSYCVPSSMFVEGHNDQWTAKGFQEDGPDGSIRVRSTHKLPIVFMQSSHMLAPKMAGNRSPHLLGHFAAGHHDGDLG
jgi:hypothetical protein